MPVLAAVLAMLALAPSPPAEARASVDFHNHRLSNSTLVWRRPVPGAVARPFAYGANPFRAGWHRGVDLAAPPGSPVRAACSGVVVTARPGVVTLRCGPWRVTHLPLASHAVAVGDAVRAGRVVGTVGVERRAPRACTSVSAARVTASRTWTRSRSSQAARPPRPPSHRRARPASRAPVRAAPARRPLPRARLGRRPRTVPRVPTAVVPLDARGASGRGTRRCARRRPRPRRVAARGARPRAASRRAARAVRVSSPAGAGGLAPWPAWVGLALLLVGAVGGGVRVRVRRGRARVSSPVPSAR